MDKEINVLALVKGEERFIFLFDDENRDETLRQLARFAADPELDFSWYDAAMLSRKIRDAVPTDEEMFASEEFDSLSIEDFQ
jgi:ABC-type transporter MlaC component